MKIAAFNIQKFGRSKVSDPDVLKILVKIISRYDIIVILEVVDNTKESVTALMQALNKIIVYGDDMLQAVVPKSAKTFNFQEAYKLSDEQALKVSDHYPVEVKLKTLGEQ